MKKLLGIVLSAAMLLSMAACGSTATSSAAADSTADAATATDAAASDLKVGVITIGDETEGYTAAHINGIKAAAQKLGMSDSQIVWKYKVPEGAECSDAAEDLVGQGCNLVVSNSYGHQTYIVEEAEKYPDVTFVSMTGDFAALTGLDNFKNAFTNVYESRYVAGVVAGMKLQELVESGTLTPETQPNSFTADGKVKIGYVGAFPYAEVVSGYTAFYLGIKSVYENAWMEVQYTGSWFDLSKENEAAKQLISDGCIIIGQHADSTGAPQACQEALKSGTTVYSIGYNIDMLATAPDAALTSATNNWGVYYTYAIAQAMRGQKVATNWVGGFDIDAVAVTQLGSACAAGTAEKVAEVEKAIHDGTLQVFDTSKFTISTKCTDGSYRTDDNGKVLVACATDTDSNFANDTDNAIIDGAYQESYTQSAPSFVLRIDGIKELNANS